MKSFIKESFIKKNFFTIMNEKTNKKNDKGFTLVELIVVLVILAILAAILIPTLIGYIEKARNERYLTAAKVCKDAAQAKFVELYAPNGNIATDHAVVTGENLKGISNNGDMDVVYNEFGQDILSMAGVTGDTAPYFFMVAVGSNQDKTTLNKKDEAGPTEQTEDFDKFTIFYAVYIETEDAKPWYYYNGEWTTTSPRYNDNGKTIFNGNNVVTEGPLKGKRLQYYLISNKTKYTSKRNNTRGPFNTRDFWTWLNSMK